MSRYSRAGGGVVRALVTFVAVTAAVLISLVGSGCGPANPQAVVKKFLTAIQDNNWYGYLSSILPERVREMTNEEMNLRREAFKEHKEDFKDVKLDVKPDRKDKDSAEVIMVGGTVSRKNPQTGEPESRSIVEFPEEQRTMKTRKYKGRWYVDIVLVAGTGQPDQVEPEG